MREFTKPANSLSIPGICCKRGPGGRGDRAAGRRRYESTLASGWSGSANCYGKPTGVRMAPSWAEAARRAAGNPTIRRSAGSGRSVPDRGRALRVATSLIERATTPSAERKQWLSGCLLVRYLDCPITLVRRDCRTLRANTPGVFNVPERRFEGGMTG